MKPINIMLDLETVGTHPGSGILSIGACTFTTDYVDKSPIVNKSFFYAGISFNSLKDEGFDYCNETLKWWLDQAPDAYAKAFSGTDSISSALYKFTAWIATLGCEPVIWGNGSDFDNAILAAAYKKMGMVQPWKYKNSRCYRTLKELYPAIKPAEFKGLRHDPVSDALNQAVHAELILEAIHAASH